MEISAIIPDVEDSKFDVDSGEEPDPVAIHQALAIIAAELGLSQYVFAEPALEFGA
jgi:hypothetical protein